MIQLSSRKNLYAEAEGLRLTIRGKVQNPAEALEPLSKGERRRVRKWLDSIGRRDLSKASVASFVRVTIGGKEQNIPIRKLTPAEKKEYLKRLRPYHT